jgi:Winged helix DNA-binding domain
VRGEASRQRDDGRDRRVPGGRAGDRVRLSPTRARLEAYRQHAFRQAAGRRIRSARAALAFVEAVGICSTFYRFPAGVACLWEAVAGRANPRWPRRSHHDAGIGLTWELKNRLPARRSVYYGKLLKGRPVLIALDVFPAFYALVRGRQRARDYRAEYEAGRLSLTARRLMDVLIARHPLYTREWRAECFLLEPRATREFERAVAELQQALFALKVEERYEPSFSYRWDLVEAWLPDAVRAGRRLRRPAAVRRLVERYLAGAGWAAPGALARLFGLSTAEVAAATSALARDGLVRTDLRVDGLPAGLVVHRAALGRGVR